MSGKRGLKKTRSSKSLVERTGCQTAILLNMGGSYSNLQTLLHIQKMEGKNTGCERKILKNKNGLSVDKIQKYGYN